MAFNFPGFGGFQQPQRRPPQPRQRQPLNTKQKKQLRTVGIVVAVLIGIFVIVPPLVSVYTGWMWFDSLAKGGVFGTILGTRLGLFLIFGALSAVILYLCMELAHRTKPTTPAHPNPVLDPYRRMGSGKHKPVFSVIAAVLGIFFGFSAQMKWQQVSVFFNAQSFGVNDPQFGRDLGFYAFQLPFFNILVTWLVSLVAIGVILNIFLHYFQGSLELRPRQGKQRGSVVLAQKARQQIAVLGGILILLVGVRYWLDRYELLSGDINFKDQTITGAGFTSANVLMSVKLLLTVIAVFCAVAFFTSFVIRDLRIPALATAIMLIGGVAVGSILPWAVEQLSVKPNKANKEAEFIERNIQATRFAYNLGDNNLTVMPNFGKESAPVPQPGGKGVASTLANIRLLDPNVLSPAFTQSKQLRSFYGFPQTLSIDRYQVDGQLRDYVVAVREINPSALTGNQTDWINRHTVYTHGNGIVMAPANTVDAIVTDAGDRGGNPKYEVYDLQSLAAKQAREKATANGAQRSPVPSDTAQLELREPRVYYGPLIAKQNPDYAIVKTAGESQEYDVDGSNYTYQGAGGVHVGSVGNRLAYAIEYRELNFILSTLIGGDSKILLNRDPRARVEAVAPWLTADTSAYPAVIDGHIKWIVDAYTTLDSLPYSQKINLGEVTTDSQTSRRDWSPTMKQVSYIRNSVKAVVDSYDGSVQLYTFDEKDPVLKAWKRVFPGLVKPKSDMSEQLRQHIRYPEDMFKAQREILSRYHVTNPLGFYTGGSYWQVPNEPTISENEASENAAARGLFDQPPYYVVSADPRTGRPSFQLTTPMLWNQREFLSSQISVSSDPDNYGHITIRQWPTNTTTQGPKNALDRMTSAGGYQTEKLQLEGANTIIYGNLLTLPIGDGGVLYVEPLYAQRKGQESAYPKLIRVMVMYNNRMGYGRSLSDALEQVGLDGSLVEQPDGLEGDGTAPPIAKNPAPGGMTRDEAAAKLSEALAALKQAQASGDMGRFGEALQNLDRAVQDYQSADK